MLLRSPFFPSGAESPPLQKLIWGFPAIMATLFWGPHNKDYSILRSILGSPYLGKLPFIQVTLDCDKQSAVLSNPLPIL